MTEEDKRLISKGRVYRTGRKARYKARRRLMGFVLSVGDTRVAIRHAKRCGTTDPWLADIIASKPTKVAAVALANKNARIAWALLRQGGTYRRHVVGSLA